MVSKVIILVCGLIIGIVLTCVAISHGLASYMGGSISWVEDEDGVYPYIEGDKPWSEVTKRNFIILKIRRTENKDSNG